MDDNSQDHGEELFPHPCKRPPRKCRQERFLRHFEMQSAGKLDNFCGGRNANTTYRCRPRFWSSVAGSGILGQGGGAITQPVSQTNYMHELSKGYMNKRRNEKTAQRRRRRRQGQKKPTASEMGEGRTPEVSELSAVLRMRGMNTAPSIVRRDGRRRGREGECANWRGGRAAGEGGRRRLLTNEPLTHSLARSRSDIGRHALQNCQATQCV